MSTRALHEDIKMIEVPINYEERDGESKLSVVNDGLRFLFSILGTASIYNPVRLLGALSLVAVVLAALALLPWLMAVGNGVQDRGAYANLLFVAMTLAIVAVNLFSIGTVFNYIVSLFHHRPIRQGLFGRPVFRRPLEHRFGTTGVGPAGRRCGDVRRGGAHAGSNRTRLVPAGAERHVRDDRYSTADKLDAGVPAD